MAEAFWNSIHASTRSDGLDLIDIGREFVDDVFAVDRELEVCKNDQPNGH